MDVTSTAGAMPKSKGWRHPRFSDVIFFAMLALALGVAYQVKDAVKAPDIMTECLFSTVISANSPVPGCSADILRDHGQNFGVASVAIAAAIQVLRADRYPVDGMSFSQTQWCGLASAALQAYESRGFWSRWKQSLWVSEEEEYGLYSRMGLCETRAAGRRAV